MDIEGEKLHLGDAEVGYSASRFVSMPGTSPERVILGEGLYLRSIGSAVEPGEGQMGNIV